MEPVGEEDWEFLVMIVLDTHVLVWWVNGDGGLSSGTKAAIEKERKDENGIILISSISAWEIAMLVQKGRLTLATNVDDWLSTVQEIDVVRFVPSITMLPFSRRDSPTNFIPIPLTG